ncbi:MAG: cysteine desulfurase [Saprospiraceae bacterium]|nr:cysteine desulfurase [Saprospiraceae bacterium]MCB9318760.1 cysteine desulfurase [Lewinellaceae bacterium]
MIYVDNAATTPISPEVFEAMKPWLTTNYGNPSSIHAEGRKARTAIEQARKTVAHYLEASIGEVFFTSCGTESINTAIKRSILDLGVQRIITSPIEHHCTLHSVEAVKRDFGIDVEYLPVSKTGLPDLDVLRNLLRNHNLPTLVTLMHANNEIGTLTPIREISAMCQEAGAYFLPDTVQSIAKYPLSVREMPVTFLAGSAHKFHGPKGIGFMYINGDVKINPLIDGGSQERTMRSGTENIAYIVGLAKALELYINDRYARQKHIDGLRRYLADQLLLAFPGAYLNGDGLDNTLYTVLSIAFPPHPKNELLLLQLDIAGICASGGSACTSGAEAASHVLEGIGADPDYKTIRFSFSHYNTMNEMDEVVRKVKGILG